MELLNFISSLFSKNGKSPAIISTGGGGGGGGFGGGAGGAGGSVNYGTNGGVSWTPTVILLLLLVWFATAIIRLENYHYASQVGLCAEFVSGEDLIQKDKCLNEKQPRKSTLLTILYGLNIL